MNIELTKEQYLKLLELVYLGEWMANSYRRKEDFNEAYDEIMQYILSFAKDLDLDLVDYDEEGNYYFTTRKFEESLSQTIDEYDNNTFWLELANRLAERDLLREIGPVNELSDQHYGRKLELEEKYLQEFERNGLKNLQLKTNKE